MALSISFVLLLGTVVVVLIRGRSVKPGPAIVCALFGSFLSSTSMAPNINRFMTSIVDVIGQIRFQAARLGAGVGHGLAFQRRCTCQLRGPTPQLA